jgi:hypothetical protein
MRAKDKVCELDLLCGRRGLRCFRKPSMPSPFGKVTPAVGSPVLMWEAAKAASRRKLNGAVSDELRPRLASVLGVRLVDEKEGAPPLEGGEDLILT